MTSLSNENGLYELDETGSPSVVYTDANARIKIVPLKYENRHKALSGEVIINRKSGDYGTINDEGQYVSATENLRDEIERVLELIASQSQDQNENFDNKVKEAKGEIYKVLDEEFYTLAEVDEKFYNKEEIDESIYKKDDTYNKTEVNQRLSTLDLENTTIKVSSDAYPDINNLDLVSALELVLSRIDENNTGDNRMRNKVTILENKISDIQERLDIQEGNIDDLGNQLNSVDIINDIVSIVIDKINNPSDEHDTLVVTMLNYSKTTKVEDIVVRVTNGTLDNGSSTIVNDYLEFDMENGYIIFRAGVYFTETDIKRLKGQAVFDDNKEKMPLKLSVTFKNVRIAHVNKHKLVPNINDKSVFKLSHGNIYSNSVKLTTKFEEQSEVEMPPSEYTDTIDYKNGIIKLPHALFDGITAYVSYSYYYDNESTSKKGSLNNLTEIEFGTQDLLANYSAIVSAPKITGIDPKEVSGYIGSIWVDSKTSKSVIIGNSGSSNMQGDKTEVGLFIVENVSGYENMKSGNGKFKSDNTHTLINHNLGGELTDYMAFIQIKKSEKDEEKDSQSNEMTAVGDLWINHKDRYCFTVEHTGMQKDNNYDWVIIKKQENISGTAKFNSLNGTKINLKKPLKNDTYNVLIQPIKFGDDKIPNGHLGEIFITDVTTDSFTVYNTGVLGSNDDFSLSFDWHIVED